MSWRFFKLLAFGTPRPVLLSLLPWVEFERRIFYRKSCKSSPILSNSLKFTLKLSLSISGCT